MRHLKIMFLQSNENRANPQESLTGFNSSRRLNEGFFTEEVKQLILKTANAIAGSFSARNKSELIMLTDLADILKS